MPEFTVRSPAAAIWGLRQDAITDAADDNHRLGVVLTEQTTRTFQAVDFVPREFADKIVSARIDDLNSPHNAFGGLDVHEALVNRLTALPQAGSFAILDSAGRLVNQTRQWPNARAQRSPTGLKATRAAFRSRA